MANLRAVDGRARLKLRSSIRGLMAALACALALPAYAQSTTPPAPAPQNKPAAAKPAVQRKLMPVDEGAEDASWTQFRNGLLESLQRDDRRALISIVDPNVLNALEAPRGIAEFRKLWDIDGKQSRLPRELIASLQLGSVWYQPKKGVRMLCAPYVPLKWPLDDVDPYDSGAIVVKEALIKDAPSHASQTLDTLNYDIVAVRDWEVDDRESQLQQRWVKIRHAGRDGYVPAEHIRSAIEHRACFGKTAAGWRLLEYVLGIEYLGGSE
jgi:hypothetical protein